MPERRPVLQKGDNFRIPGNPRPQRYVAETFKALRYSQTPTVQFFRRQVTTPAGNSDDPFAPEVLGLLDRLIDDLDDRYEFLTTQRDDLVKSIRATGDAIARINRTTGQRFRDAFTAINTHFQETFSTLFGGGRAGLVLLDESDLLESGIDIIAQPPGKRLQSIQLLSGGEKSLTAVAMLVAIFRARPSPFYVMDEVEAALDDVNLRRLISLFEQLRERSQLIVITHQKPTMEVADALYGVSMRGDGITTVISQRMRGQELVSSRT